MEISKYHERLMNTAALLVVAIERLGMPPLLILQIVNPNFFLM